MSAKRTAWSFCSCLLSDGSDEVEDLPMLNIDVNVMTSYDVVGFIASSCHVLCKLGTYLAS